MNSLPPLPSLYPLISEVEQALYIEMSEIAPSKELPQTIKGEAQILLTRGGQPYIGVVVNKEIVLSWVMHILNHSHLFRDDFLEFLECSREETIEKIGEMLILSQVRDSRSAYGITVPEYHITLISPPQFNEMEEAGITSQKILDYFGSQALVFQILGVGYAEGTMTLEQGDSKTGDMPGGSLYISVHLGGARRDHRGTHFAIEGFVGTQGLHITIGFKSIDNGSGKLNYGDVFFGDNGDQLVKDNPNIVSTPKARRFHLMPKDNRTDGHIKEEHARHTCDKPSQLGFLNPRIPTQIIEELNGISIDGSDRFIQSIWIAEKYRSRALMILCKEAIGYQGLMTLGEIHRILGIRTEGVSDILKWSFSIRSKIGKSRHSDANNYLENEVQETVDNLNIRLQGSPFMFMNRTGFIAMSVILPEKILHRVPQLHSIIIPGNEMSANNTWLYSTMYPGTDLNPRFPHDRTRQLDIEAAKFWIPKNPEGSPVFLYRKNEI